MNQNRVSVDAIAKTSQPILQIVRSVFHGVQICVAIWAFTTVGFMKFQAIVVRYPLIIVAPLALFLGERLG